MVISHSTVLRRRGAARTRLNPLQRLALNVLYRYCRVPSVHARQHSVATVTAPVATTAARVAAGAYRRVHLEGGCGDELCRGDCFAGREFVGLEYRQ